MLTVALASYGGASAPDAAHASADPITVSFDPQTQYQFQGFGTSLAWWANVVGGFSAAQRSQIEDALFSTSTPDNPNRLGLNVIRYNIGASPANGNPPAPDLSSLPANCQTWDAGRAIPVVQPGPGQPINLGLDTNQIRVLTEAMSRINADGQPPVLEAFANSAPYWMTISGCPQGNGSVNNIAGIPVPAPQDNLAPNEYVPYAQYLVSVLKAFRDQDGITFNSVEPLNEPGNPWVPNGPQNKQEGMQLGTAGPAGTPGGQQTVIGALCSLLKDAGMSGTVISAPDGFNPDGQGNQGNPGIIGPFLNAFADNTSADIGQYGPSTLGCLAKINTHMYNVSFDLNTGSKVLLPYQGAGRQAFAASVANLGTPKKRIWMSEFGSSGGPADMGSALALADEITRDLRYLRPSAWVYWQALGSNAFNSDGLIDAPGFPAEGALAPDFPNNVDVDSTLNDSLFITPTKRYFALEQFSRFIRPGDVIVKVNDPLDDPTAEHASTLAAFDPNANTLTIVATNDNPDPGGRAVTFDINGIAPQASGPVQAYRTEPQLDINVQPDPQPLQMSGGQFSDTLGGDTIETYVIPLAPGSVTGFAPNTPPVVSAGPDVTGPETNAITLNGSASDADGDPLRIAWSAGPATGTTDPGASCTFADPTSPTTTITCSDEGDYQVTLTADDGVNLPVSSTATVHVTNLGPSISITSPQNWDQFQAPSTTVNLAAPITDPGGNDTHTCTINWDDGTTDTFAHEVNCDHAHTFAHPGIYTVKVTATDDDQRSAAASVIVVVTDPDAGFVTGGGFINSPPGAYTPDPTVAGKVHFSLLAFYPGFTGSTTPVGNISIRIQDIHRDVDVSGLDWLVVAPDGEAAVKGAGTLGSQDVRFIMYGYQGCGDGSGPECQPGSDRFRVVIWPSAQGLNPTAPFIYDNVPGADLELADATPQPLGGGNIEIHG